jgi:hypothetical protein
LCLGKNSSRKRRKKKKKVNLRVKMYKIEEPDENKIERIHSRINGRGSQIRSVRTDI